MYLKKKWPIMHSSQEGESVWLHLLSIKRSWWSGSALDHDPSQQARRVNEEELHFTRPIYMRDKGQNTKREDRAKSEVVKIIQLQLKYV